MTQDNTSTDVGSTKARLKSFASRITNMEEEIEKAAEDIKEIFKEAKGEGFDVKILRKALRLMRQDKQKREEEQSMVDLYLSSLEG